MRKFNTAFGSMPTDLIEYKADIVSASTGKFSPGDQFQACRFGYSIRWCDGSSEQVYITEETLEAAILKGAKSLEEKGWKLDNGKYTGNDITGEIIEKYTKVLPDTEVLRKSYARYLQLQVACINQPWYDTIRSELSRPPSIFNIATLPEKTREYSTLSLISYDSTNGVNVLTKWKEDFDKSYVSFRSWGEEYTPIDKAKKMFGLSEYAADIDVVNAVVKKLEQTVTEFNNKTHKTYVEFIERFDTLVNKMDIFFTKLKEGSYVADELFELVTRNLYIDGSRSSCMNGVHRYAMLYLANSITYLDIGSMEMNRFDIPNGGKVTEVTIRLNDRYTKMLDDLVKSSSVSSGGDWLDSFHTHTWPWECLNDNVMHIIYGKPIDDKPILETVTNGTTDSVIEELYLKQQVQHIEEDSVVEDVVEDDEPVDIADGDFEGYENAEDKD